MSRDKNDTKSLSLRMPMSLYEDVEEWSEEFHWQNTNQLLIHLIDIGLRTQKQMYRRITNQDDDDDGPDDREGIATSSKQARAGNQ